MFRYPCDVPAPPFRRLSQHAATPSHPPPSSHRPAGVNMSSLRFAWSSTIGGATNSGKGRSTWSGTATGLTTVSVTVTDSAGGIAGFSDSKTIRVTARNWTWGDSIVNARPTFSSLDSCFPAGTVAVTAPANCAAAWVQSSYTRGGGGGPWTGVDYVADATVTVDVEWAYAREFRSDGPHYAMRGDADLLNGCPDSLATMNVLVANTACGTTQTQFNSLVAFAVAHEGRHIDAITTEAAQHDLLADWEPVVGSESHVTAEVSRIATNIENAIDGASDWPHTTGPTYDVWLWDGSNGWQLLPVTVAN